MKTIEEREWALIQRLARKAEKGLKVPQEFLDFASIFITAQSGFKQAIQLSDMLHSDQHGLSSIQEFLNENPLNSLSLMNLISIERAKGESELEKEIKRKMAEENAKRKLAKDLKQQWKHEVVKPKWLEWQKNPDLYKKADFIRAMYKLPSCPLKKEDEESGLKTIGNWCTSWKKEMSGKGVKPAQIERQEKNDMVLQLVERSKLQEKKKT